MTTTLEKPNTTTFGQLVHERRRDLGWTQERVARAAGCSVGYVGLIEQGKRGARPSHDICRRFAQALRLDLPEIEELMRAAGHLSEGEHLFTGTKTTVAAAINADPLLSERQKRMMAGIYEELVRVGAH